LFLGKKALAPLGGNPGLPLSWSLYLGWHPRRVNQSPARRFHQHAATAPGLQAAMAAGAGCPQAIARNPGQSARFGRI